MSGRGTHFSPGILAYTLETQKLTRIEYIAIFQVEISIGDVFAYTPLQMCCFAFPLLAYPW